MEFEDTVQLWITYFNVTRQIGHTHAALNGVNNVDKARIVVPFENYGEHYYKDKYMNFNNLQRGLICPVVFDNSTVHYILQQTLNEIKKRKQAEEDYLKLKLAIQKNLTVNYNMTETEPKSITYLGVEYVRK